ncbi:hypothetical protein BMETH_801_1 [methanotrophic bacterial endosymbiont of Bathymodiolus sp.]|nr:hypothetical protein BMETH_801_1 [methanotrophic bacterial endosymbiont of Bathymodiolus sp.]
MSIKSGCNKQNECVTTLFGYCIIMPDYPQLSAITRHPMLIAGIS